MICKLWLFVMQPSIKERTTVIETADILQTWQRFQHSMYLFNLFCFIICFRSSQPPGSFPRRTTSRPGASHASRLCKVTWHEGTFWKAAPYFTLTEESASPGGGETFLPRVYLQCHFRSCWSYYWSLLSPRYAKLRTLNEVVISKKKVKLLSFEFEYNSCFQ